MGDEQREMRDDQNFTPAHPGEIPENGILIVGAGHFGLRAAEIMTRQSSAPIFVVDRDQGALSRLKSLPVEKVPCDGIRFLVEEVPELNPECIIVPAVPVHLAYGWLVSFHEGTHDIRRISVPEAVKDQCPFWWDGSEGSLLASYADFMCPDDCPEPLYCTVTGEKRDPALYALLRGLSSPDFKVHVIRSRQLAPGLGGYRVKDLTRAAQTITRSLHKKWLLGTACRCHGVLTAFEIGAKSKNQVHDARFL